jgi:hypothetical protein
VARRHVGERGVDARVAHEVRPAKPLKGAQVVATGDRGRIHAAFYQSARRCGMGRAGGARRQSVWNGTGGASIGLRARRSYSAMTWAPNSSSVAASSRLSSTMIAVVSEP